MFFKVVASLGKDVIKAAATFFAYFVKRFLQKNAKKSEDFRPLI